MTTVSRRAFVGMTTVGVALGSSASVYATDSPAPSLSPLTTNAKPITAEEFGARLAKLQSLMRDRKVGAFLVESGSSLEYFTGIRWRRSERITAAVIPAEGGIIVVTPFFEEPSIRELLRVPAEVRPWQEDENAYDLIARALRDRAPVGPLAVEETTRFFIIDRMRKSSGAGRDIVSGEDLVRACRTIKSTAELALLQAANNVTIAAIRHVHGQVDAGMQWPDILKLQIVATEALGGTHEFTLVLLNEASAFPHGSEKPQVVGKGSVILIDTGCSVHGYVSDISRTWVFGEPSARQREVWNTVKRGQEIAQETAKVGAAGRRHRQGCSRVLRRQGME